MPLRSLLLAGACALASIASASPLAIELRSDALVAHAQIALADVAIVRADEELAATLGSIALGQAPRVGYVERLTRAQLEQAIRRHAPAGQLQVAWSGANSVAVRIASQTVRPAELADAAVTALRSRFAAPGLQLDVAPLSSPAALDVPAGQLELRARALSAQALAPRVPLWIDLVVDGALYRSVVVPLAVTARRAAYVATRDLESGALATRDDFAIADSSIAGTDALAVTSALAPFRLRQPLKAGQVLAAGAVHASGQILRGDQVRLVIHTGQIGIETVAVAMAEGAPGQLISVRPLGASDNVTGRVSQPGTVTIE